MTTTTPSTALVTGGVTVQLVGGPHDGECVRAPRDDHGRILGTVWVERSAAGVTAYSSPTTALDLPPAVSYRFESWTTRYPIYRHAAPADEI